MSNTEAYFVTRTVRALECLAHQPLSAPQLADRLQIHPRTARRMLSRLVDEQYVALLPGPRRRYTLTKRLLVVAGHAAMQSFRSEWEGSPTCSARALGVPCLGPAVGRVNA